MIDLMVERLVRLRGEPVDVPQPRNDAEAADTIRSLAGNLHAALASANAAGGSFAAGVVEPGMVFSFVA
jgi:hypothetical protein